MGFQEVHWALPLLHLLQPHFLGTALVIPDDDDFLQFGAVHVGVAADVFEDELEVLLGIVGGGDESEPADSHILTFGESSSGTRRKSNRRKWPCPPNMP